MTNPQVRLDTTEGSMLVELFEDRAPKTAGNFLGLVRKGFYDGLTFHRVIPEFMIQGGCPKGDGTGGPGYTIADELNPSLRHDRAGILSMANAGPNTGGSQFFITVAPAPWLDGRHAIFGKLVGGTEIAERISRLPRDRNDRPRSTVRITVARVV